ncbi:MAG: response regulator [Pseudomonadota bacterium]
MNHELEQAPVYESNFCESACSLIEFMYGQFHVFDIQQSTLQLKAAEDFVLQLKNSFIVIQFSDGLYWVDLMHQLLQQGKILATQNIKVSDKEIKNIWITFLETLIYTVDALHTPLQLNILIIHWPLVSDAFRKWNQSISFLELSPLETSYSIEPSSIALHEIAYLGNRQNRFLTYCNNKLLLADHVLISHLTNIILSISEQLSVAAACNQHAPLIQISEECKTLIHTAIFVPHIQKRLKPEKLLEMCQQISHVSLTQGISKIAEILVFLENLLNISKPKTVFHRYLRFAQDLKHVSHHTNVGFINTLDLIIETIENCSELVHASEQTVESFAACSKRLTFLSSINTLLGIQLHSNLLQRLSIVLKNTLVFDTIIQSHIFDILALLSFSYRWLLMPSLVQKITHAYVKRAEELIILLEQHPGEINISENVIEQTASIPTSVIISDEKNAALQEKSSEIIEVELVIPPLINSSFPEEDTDDLKFLFRDEAMEILTNTNTIIAQFSAHQFPRKLLLFELQRDFHTIKGAAQIAEETRVEDIASTGERMIESLIDGRTTWNQNYLNQIHQMQRILESLVVQYDPGVAQQHNEDVHALIDKLKFLQKKPYTSSVDEHASSNSLETISPEQQSTFSEKDNAIVYESITHDKNLTAEKKLSALKKPLAEVKLSPFVDQEILSIFLEEAADLIDAIHGCVNELQTDEWSNTVVDTLKRHLHTFKGSARLSGFTELGDITHELESLLDQHSDSFKDHVGQRIEVATTIASHIEHISGFLETWQNLPLPDPSYQENLHQENVYLKNLLSEEIHQPLLDNEEIAPPKAVPLGAPTPRSLSDFFPQTQTTSLSGQESVRIPLLRLENLISHAGELSINRGRLEQQCRDVNTLLVDVRATLSRMREKLRSVELEFHHFAYANISAYKSNRDVFDTIEMDQYTPFYEFTRSLSESVSDLSDIQDSLTEHNSTLHGLVEQQTSIHHKLQSELMQSRMVPFSKHVGRLKRMVRKTAADVGKLVQIDIENPEEELDRNVLDRIITPLEHMLRNAIDHGIETTEARVAQGKPRTGVIRLKVLRVNNEVSIILSDDGGGIHIDKIRSRAIEHGWLSPDKEVQASELIHLIFKSGFSTAETLTQLSGRGVGMDVVYSEIKKLGGTIDVFSEVGQGSTFDIRLPLTLAVTRALLVRLVDDVYAIPLNQIGGVVRINPYELHSYYQNPARKFIHNSKSYTIRYLGGLTHKVKPPEATQSSIPKPLLLMRGDGPPTALQVDELVGSREIVVKNLGPLLNTINGISGAAIMGNGDVVTILDLPALIRGTLSIHSADSNGIFTHATLDQLSQSHLAEAKPEAPVVLIVDDSITVRKVTSRLLQRHGFEALNAKDGLDAISVLQTHKPDLILLDIEMPRMDGFEVALHIRHDPIHHKTPIVMISSRTGDKHRQKAMSIGVNQLLAKPYQESELLELIVEILGLDRASFQKKR